MNAADVKRKWAQLAPREQHLVAAAAGLIAAALLWWLVLAPPLAVLQSAAVQHRALDAQLQQMLGLQAQAQSLQSQPRQSADETTRLLEATTRETLATTARMTISGERVTIVLGGAVPDALGRWLTQVRTNARALPQEARLTRNAAGLWDGTLVLGLPAR